MADVRRVVVLDSQPHSTYRMGFISKRVLLGYECIFYFQVTVELKSSMAESGLFVREGMKGGEFGIKYRGDQIRIRSRTLAPRGTCMCGGK